MKVAVFYHHVRQAANEQNIAISEMLQRVKTLGIEYIEMDLNDIEDIEAVKAELQEFQISSVYGFYEWNRGYEEEQVLRHIETARALGTDQIMIIPGFYSGQKKIKDQELDRMIFGMKQAVALANKYKMIVTIEDFDDARSPIMDTEGMLKFLNSVPDLRVTFDTGNFLYTGEIMLDAYQRLASKIVHVHCKDRTLKSNLGEKKVNQLGIPMYACSVGSGLLPVQTVIKRLKKSSYDGIYAIEHFGVEDYERAIKESAEWLDKEISL